MTLSTEKMERLAGIINGHDTDCPFRIEILEIELDKIDKDDLIKMISKDTLNQYDIILKHLQEHPEYAEAIQVSYDKENAAWDAESKRMTDMDKVLDGMIDHKCFTLSEHIASLTGVEAIKGKCRIEYGYVPAKYTSEVMENPTWLQVLQCVNEAVRISEDSHHCYFEGLIPTTVDAGIQVFDLNMGS